ncbi:MAG: hypothetical protein WBF43_02160 [Methylocella sp.]
MLRVRISSPISSERIFGRAFARAGTRHEIKHKVASIKCGLIAVAAAAFVVLGLNAALAAATTCEAPLGWWESKGLEPLFIDPKGPAPRTDCDFQVWSWTAFVHWMRTDPATGQPYFLLLPTYDDLASGDALRAKAGPRTLVLKPRNPKPKSMNAFEQAGSHGVLAGQNGRAVYYSTHMDLIYFDFTKTYFGAGKYKNAAPTLEYPIGATVLKAAWRVVAPGENTSNVFTTAATVDLLASDGKGGLVTNGQTQPNVTVALVGVHVVGVIKDHPEFTWGTFEQIGNAPDLPPGMDPKSPSPVSAQDYTFYKGGTPADASNNVSRNLKIDLATQIIAPITNVFREFAYGGATPDSRVQDIISANQNFQAGIKGHPAIKSVFANYRLIGTAWIQANTLKPGDGNLDAETIGSIDLANSTLETFVQDVGTNCFSCHNTSAGKSYPGKDINLSHVILSVLPNNTKTLEANP